MLDDRAEHKRYRGGWRSMIRTGAVTHKGSHPFGAVMAW